MLQGKKFTIYFWDADHLFDCNPSVLKTKPGFILYKGSCSNFRNNQFFWDIHKLLRFLYLNVFIYLCCVWVDSLNSIENQNQPAACETTCVSGANIMAETMPDTGHRRQGLIWSLQECRVRLRHCDAFHPWQRSICSKPWLTTSAVQHHSSQSVSILPATNVKKLQSKLLGWKPSKKKQVTPLSGRVLPVCTTLRAQGESSARSRFATPNDTAANSARLQRAPLHTCTLQAIGANCLLLPNKFRKQCNRHKLPMVAYCNHWQFNSGPGVRREWLIQPPCKIKLRILQAVSKQ